MSKKNKSINLPVKVLDEDDIPEGYEALYEEKDGVWHLDSKKLATLTGKKDDPDDDEEDDENEELIAARKKAKKLSDSLKKQKAQNESLLKRLEKLEAKKDDPKKEDEDEEDDEEDDDTDKKVPTKKKKKQKAENDELNERIKKLEEENKQAKEELAATEMDGYITKIAKKIGIVESAIPDAILLTRQEGFTKDEDGDWVNEQQDSLDTWLKGIVKSKPHWQSSTATAGLGGKNIHDGATVDYSGKVAAVDNPYTPEGWNVSKQIHLHKNHAATATRLAKQAGYGTGDPSQVILPKEKQRRTVDASAFAVEVQ